MIGGGGCDSTKCILIQVLTLLKEPTLGILKSERYIVEDD